MASLAEYINSNFPSPTEGETFLWGGVRYTFDSTPGIWVGALSEPDAVQDVATNNEPSNPNQGDLWFDPSTNRLNVFVDDDFVDANPQPTADDLGLMQAIAIEDDSVLVQQEATALNFIGDIEATSSGSTVNVTIPNIPELPDAPAQLDASEEVSYVLQIPSGSDPVAAWVTMDMAASDIMLDDIGGISVPSNVAENSILAANSVGTIEPMTISDLGLVDMAAVTSAVDTLDSDLQDQIDDVVSDVSTVQTDLGTLETTVGDLDLGDLGDVTVTSPQNGMILTYTNGMWEPADAPVMTGSGMVTINDAGTAVTIDETTTQIPVADTLSVSGGNLVLGRNGASDLTVSLDSLGNPVEEFDLTVDGNSDIDTINFGDDFTVTASGSTVNITVDIPEIPEIPEENPLAVQEDGTTRNTDTSALNFTGDGVRVINRGGGIVEVEIEGGTSDTSSSSTDGVNETISPALVQTGFTRSSTRATKDQFHLNGNPTGAKYRVMVKNNHSSNSYSIKYNFDEADSSTPNDNIASSVIFGSSGGLWDSNEEEYIMYTTGSNGQSLWRPDTFMSIPSQNFMIFEIDIKPNATVSFFTNNSSNMLWNYSTIGGTAEIADSTDTSGSGGGGGGSMTDTGTTEGSAYANGDAIDEYSGPFFIKNEPGHYNMAHNGGSFQNIIYDPLVGGNSVNLQTSTAGNQFYGLASQGNTSRDQGIWIVAYYSTTSTINDDSSGALGIVFPGSVSGGTDDGLDALMEYIDSTSISSASINASPQHGGDPDTTGNGEFKFAPLSEYGPDLGGFSDQYVFTGQSSSRPWHSVQNLQFYLPGSGGQVMEIRRGNGRSLRQSTGDSAARMFAYEMYYRVYTP